jgi:type IX secretion system PorP/SprF family membrane protein
MRKSILLLICLMFIRSLHAQNFHFDQLSYAAPFMNPAQAGLIHEKYRVNLLSRLQYMAVSPYSTHYLSFDARIKSNYNQFLGGGFILCTDRAGDGKYSSTLLQMPFSYTTKFDKEKISYLTFGGTAGVYINRTDPNKYYYENQYNGTSFDQNLPNQENVVNNKFTYKVFGAGANYVYLLSDASSVSGGTSFRYFTTPKVLILTAPSQHSMQVNANLSYYKMITESSRISALMYWSKQQSAHEFQTAFAYEYKTLDENHDVRYSAGIRNRWKDAFMVNAGFKKDELSFVLSYSMMYSSYRHATNFSGAYELGVQYLLKSKRDNTPEVRKRFQFM